MLRRGLGLAHCRAVPRTSQGQLPKGRPSCSNALLPSSSPHRRSFSSSNSEPPVKSPPKATLFQTVLEAFDDRERLYEWDRDGLFDPDMPESKKAMMFLFFHRYFDPPFDLPDFLDGAQVALDLVFHTMYSHDFLAAAASDDATSTYKSETLLESIMTRACVDSIKKEFIAYHADGYTQVALTQLDIHECSLHDVTISKDYEYLYMDVLYRTTEHLSMDKEGDDATTTDVRDSHCQLRYQTKMDNLDHLDWSIAQVFDH
ncbi:hypothetical protein H257_04218 [Aphanomyces astaci]|uniref:Tim44-like domain-containing protein n=1 Tax=Aphanomyces astaci TaxID=112090 RepID=W4GUZ1_APHAT|nr:hypothetical protein H257_04218 [Aphanomyces astaci]ETV83502.1 hypothetical protein H257_04218 [Aphanomyces astaci]|eukprot:XP_009826932.1 hypothetical protein H257_04218 [Aphanomyces astaci]